MYTCVYIYILCRSVAILAQVISQSGSIIPTCSAKRGRRRHCAQCLRRPRLAEQVGIILRPTFVPSSLHGIVPRLIILLYNPNGGSGVPPIFYRGPRGPSPAVAGSPPARRRVPAACGGVPPIICRGPRGPLPTIGGSPQGPRCMWWGSPHQGPRWACQEKTLPSLIRLGSISPDALPAQ